MYTSNGIAEKIKEQAKMKKIFLKDMLQEIGLSKNAVSTMLLGSMPKADTLAKIADYLGCSVDYLLGRTDNPEVRQ